MCFFVDLAQPCRADVRVDLSGHQALVPEQLLHAAYIGPAVEKMRCEAVAECVWRRSPVEAGFLEVLETGANEIQVEEDIRVKALQSTQRMLDFARTLKTPVIGQSTT